MMENQGIITAMDVEGWKLGELQKRARRAGIDIIDTQQIRNAKDIKNLNQTADRLLLDAPCTGMGVLRRNPDAKWKLTPEHVEWVRNTQAEIIDDYSTMLRPGGKMVYATCSILPMEGEEQIKWFIEKHAEHWLLDGEKRYAPTQFDADGFYMALLTRK
jgi:16S rRNA (cytosine967-C5)-methyltransferase